MMSRSIPSSWARAAWALAAIAGLAAPAIAQTPTATLAVEVRDATDAVMPDVTVMITNRDTGQSRRGVTNPQGTVVLPLLAPGTYVVAASKVGFKTELIRDVRLQASVKSTLTIVLDAGAVDEPVDVTADRTTLVAGDSAVGEVIDRDRMASLPVLERDALQFAQQAPGVAPPAPGSRLSTQGNVGLNVAGARESANNFLLDGTDNNDLFLNRLVVNPSLEALEEVSLLQNTYDAAYGRSAGGQVNMIVKSGTSDLKGSAYEFFRNSALDHKNSLLTDDEPEPALNKHQFGGTLGGPLGRWPSFFFTNVEVNRANEADTRLAHVPTTGERAGDFRAAGVTVFDPFTQRPFPGNVIPAGRIDPVGANIAALYPAPNRTGDAANLVSSPEGRRDGVQFTIKTDHHGWRDKPIQVRYTFSREDRDLPFPTRSRNLPGFGVAVVDQGHQFSASLSRTSGRLFHETRFGFNALDRENSPQSAAGDPFAALGITAPPSLGPVDQGYMTMVLPGFETLGDDTNLPVRRQTRTLHLSETLGLDRGRHHAKFGGELRDYHSDGYNHLFSRGQAVFTGAFTGHPMGDLLLGYPTITLLAANDNRQALRTWSANVYAQDDWRVSSRVTINAGLRYEFNAPPVDADDRMVVFDPETNTLVPVGQNGVPRSGLDSDYNNFAPRAGLSWDLTGRGTLVLRAGYGLFYDSGTLIENSALYFNPPYWQLGLFFPSETDPIQIANPFPGEGFPTAPTVNSIDRRFRTGYAQQVSAGLERAFTALTLTARYVGAFGDGYVRKRNINPPPPGPGDIADRRPIPGFGDILVLESEATSRYHALQLAVDRPFSHGLQFKAGYTWSTSMDDTSAFLATDGDDNTPQDSRNFAAEWGPSDFDVRHRMVASASWIIPAKPGASAFLRDWQVSGVFTAQSGRPFTPRVSFDNSNTGNVGGGTFAYDRPNVVTGAPPPDAVFYNGEAFVIAPQYTFGNAGRNSLTGPAYASLDLAASKRIPIGGRRLLDLRFELFNALSRQNLSLPDSFVDRPTFGQSLSALPARQVQLSARVTF
jgi:outer membrane receptor protein involved in Fe transport